MLSKESCTTEMNHNIGIELSSTSSLSIMGHTNEEEGITDEVVVVVPTYE